ncbi:hypothetical protein QTQ03_05335 [Micromonospora sp. WMMA1363]|uniref:hypothetical protein n=1 Tax=Micromonospora sp. WMMA1363 TaxID=3053985 RepID=UPI00259C884A|nr:hypothetical protein [Micromonospora sp. WMMA1363]MDM4719046.1 hypothetical protein [Micromonospora sp. WMMA1363]
MDSSPTRRPQDTQTVRRLRLGIGIVGVALPAVLIVGHALVTGRLTLLDSISAYYYTPLRDVLVGSLCAIGVFLISYRRRKFDDLLSTVAGGLAIVVALFPAATQQPDATISSNDVLVGRVHQVAAAALFAILAIFCIVLFPRRHPHETHEPVRNVLYYACGGLILTAIVAAVASNALAESTRELLRPLFWCEAVAVLAFGVAWFAKGEAMFGQPPATGVPAPDPVPTPGGTSATPAAP